MESLKILRRRIRSVSSTMQLTRAMELVSAAKLRKAQTRLVSSRPYASKMQVILENLSSASTTITHPLFEKREVKHKCLVIITSDRGLCGSYNVNVFRKAEEFLSQESKNKIKLVLIGKKGFYHYRRRPYEIRLKYIDLGGKLELTRTKEITANLVNLFLSREVDEIFLLYTKFLTVTSYRVALDKFLNIERPEEEEKGYIEYIFEPSAEMLFDNLLPRYCLTRVQIALSEAFASEQGSRMIAMGSATRNADEMIDQLTLLRNKARQAAITKEMVEIASGVEALK
ncbi:MAG: ATP synthase F1 subunit gamma [candidate division Zixibacteria bacterium]|nr:ATP synthase F1 subunit gamma [candidate division Zixibacteria bacterium]